MVLSVRLISFQNQSVAHCFRAFVDSALEVSFAVAVRRRLVVVVVPISIAENTKALNCAVVKKIKTPQFGRVFTRFNNHRFDSSATLVKDSIRLIEIVALAVVRGSFVLSAGRKAREPSSIPVIPSSAHFDDAVPDCPDTIATTTVRALNVLLLLLRRISSQKGRGTTNRHATAGSRSAGQALGREPIRTVFSGSCRLDLRTSQEDA
uniref:Uncharacterized protein n=1 Tax=Panagrellus redivivus TaxID=6233 RepID=A0A7E4W552_PANRE